MFDVTYVDDTNRKHLCVAVDLETVKFLRERFYHVEVSATLRVA